MKIIALDDGVPSQKMSYDDITNSIKEYPVWSVMMNPEARSLPERAFGEAGVMHTWGGHEVKPADFKAADVDIQDIARSLSLINRFNGHTREPYSVAMHCLVGSHLAASNYKLEALLHDAGEAYMGDMILPVKESFPEVVKAEDKISGMIFRVLAPDLYVLTSDGNYKKTPYMTQLDKKMAFFESYYLRPEVHGFCGLPDPLADEKYAMEYIKWRRIVRGMYDDIDEDFRGGTHKASAHMRLFTEEIAYRYDHRYHELVALSNETQ